MKVALFGVSHWHFPLYRAALTSASVEVVGLCDHVAAVRAREAKHFNCYAYHTPAELIDAGGFDFGFLFGRHADMPETAAKLIAHNIPFSIEKPGGLQAGDVGQLADAAKEKGLYVSVAFVERLGDAYRTLLKLQMDEDAKFLSTSWRFFAGPPSRYPAVDCAWLLDPAVSGGGCMINLAGHFIDLSLLLHGKPPLDITARISNALHGCAVEDYAMLSLALPAGAVAQIETGYRYPDHPSLREFSFTAVGKAHYVRSHPQGIEIVRNHQQAAELIALPMNADNLYDRYARRLLTDFPQGKPPIADLQDLHAMMKIMDAAYSDARSRPHF